VSDAAVGGAVLIYDGDCGFCTASARWLQARLPGAAAVTPHQAIDLAPVGLTEAETSRAAYWVDETGSTHRGAAAIAAALAACGGTWGIIGRLLAIPPLSWLASGVYAVVARNRHRLPGATDACRLPRT